MMILGSAGPALLLLVVSWFAWQGFRAVIEQSDAALTGQVLDSNGFAAQYVSRTTANELENRYQAVERVVSSDDLCRQLSELLEEPEISELLDKMSDLKLSEADLEPLWKRFREHPDRRRLQEIFSASIPPGMKPPHGVASWFFCDPRGISTLRVPESQTIGKNFAYRSYFNGGPRDRDPSWRPEPGEHVADTHLSAVFRSQATHRWIVAVAAPLFDRSPEPRFLGVVALTVEVGRFAELQGRDNQFAVLVDRREGDNKGVILQHPLFDKLLAEQDKLPDRFKSYRVNSDDLPDVLSRQEHYADPLAADPEGAEYNRHWLARMQSVHVRGADTGWVVVVQEAYDTAIGSTLQALTTGLVRYGMIALLLVAMIMVALWGFVMRGVRG